MLHFTKQMLPEERSTIFMFGLETSALIILLICLLCVCTFEFINGFHDTANAVATVIYTNTLKPQIAVIFSGILNFFGVLFGGITVAMGITMLLPLEAVMNPNTTISIAIILSILLSAIIWNFGTWYYGIPASSSHALIGSIIGATMAFSLYQHKDLQLVNWEKATEIGLSLMISPLCGFALALFLVWFLSKVYPSEALFKAPHATDVPPTWIRGILIFTCGSVSFWHGSNDGQKGVGLLMVILIALVPVHFALNDSLDLPTLQKANTEMQAVLEKFPTNNLDTEGRRNIDAIKVELAQIKLLIENAKSFDKISREHKVNIRKHLSKSTKDADKFAKRNTQIGTLEERNAFEKANQALKDFIAYAPSWAILLISLSLGLGTMIGWKRIVITIGEKIGKEHLTYAQGASAELVATTMIAVSTQIGLPVSTTHVLSSGIAGSMVASKGLSNLQGKTIRNIAMAWVLTLPVCIACSMVIFAFASLFF